MSQASSASSSAASTGAESLPLSQAIGPHIPFLRRYARALTGSQESGDAFAVSTLEAIIADPGSFPRTIDPRVALYRLFQAIWASAHVELQTPAEDPEMLLLNGNADRESLASHRLSQLTPLSRQALLLTAMEGFTLEEAAVILGSPIDTVAGLVAAALSELDRQMSARVLIIEDEPIIALDLEGIVQQLGHEVVAVSDTRSRAVAAALEHRPDLVLADIQLADGSSGLDAVKDILGAFAVPVIFITAFPERLLTGDRPEPTFLVTKPFKPDTVRAAISQALFFRSSLAQAAA